MSKPDSLALSLRQAMRRLASGVVLVTTVDETGAPYGMAASSMIPVSMAPPSMLVAIHREASIHPVVERVRRCCLNLLGPEQSPLLEPFSRTALRAQRFTSPDWQLEAGEMPYLASAPAAVFCELERLVDYGTHTICVGRVTRVLLGPSAEPLVWLDGAARRLVNINAPDYNPASPDAPSGDSS
ncbi:MAG: flavin reductase family protein [Burkholderiaceae bacterium]